ncbi:helix-turn-helix transcriptional regulator [Draconibacterium sp. IB214405]|uniref:helix-turn-helix domain-containing protein n=1 Tax=Draconibacterium sp. IB214405 TaxID=3097352 RepID=UPI002A183F36|nr:helix-turn-helix transcriptional regulator [Draconibacterium sp. IB214405]MDX8338168.1 helix-turn-helix transcriptional regulator [Draconibacterium sp. IB214405]
MEYFNSRLLFISICSLLISSQLPARSQISGELSLDTTWSRVIYLSMIPGFDQLNAMSNQMIIDRAAIDENGNFSFTTNYFPYEYYLYRLHISKKGDPPASLIIGGNDENHIFLIANKQSDITIRNRDSESIFGQVEIQNSPQSQLLYEIDKMVLFVDTANFNGSPLKRELMENALDEKLRQIADTCTFPLTGIYAIYKSNFEAHKATNSEFYVSFIKKWKQEKSTYFDEFGKKIPVKTDRNLSYVSLIFGLIIGIFLMYFIQKRVVEKSVNPIRELTVQERNIYTMLQKGSSNKEISDELNISLSTVKSHVNSIFSKLKVKSRREILNL